MKEDEKNIDINRIAQEIGESAFEVIIATMNLNSAKSNEEKLIGRNRLIREIATLWALTAQDLAAQNIPIDEVKKTMKGDE